MERSKEMQEVVDNFAKRTFGRTLAEAHEQHVCVTCGEFACNFRDEISTKEYLISGLCQKCQDKIFGED